MSPAEVEQAIQFGHHAARHDASTLRNYSHNGIGTKACLNIFSRLAIYSTTAPAGATGERCHVLLVLDVADRHGDGKCQPARRLVWRSSGGTAPAWAQQARRA
jgi:hypothetical protein